MLPTYSLLSDDAQLLLLLLLLLANALNRYYDDHEIGHAIVIRVCTMSRY